MSLDSRKIFTAEWRDGYPKYSEDLPGNWFTSARGYPARNLAALDLIAVGETLDLSDLSGTHTLKRIR